MHFDWRKRRFFECDGALAHLVRGMGGNLPIAQKQIALPAKSLYNVIKYCLLRIRIQATLLTAVSRHYGKEHSADFIYPILRRQFIREEPSYGLYE